MSNLLKFFTSLIFITVFAIPYAKAQNIDYEKAIQIALSHANLTKNEIGFIEVEQDFDNGFIIFEIQFSKENVEYEYEINASTGKIISYGEERHRTTFTPIGPNDQLLTSEQVKQIALNHAKLSAENVRFVKISQEFEYGSSSYELKFWQNYTEYEYEIDAANGEILEFNIEYH